MNVCVCVLRSSAYWWGSVLNIASFLFSTTPLETHPSQESNASLCLPGPQSGENLLLKMVSDPQILAEDACHSYLLSISWLDVILKLSLTLKNFEVPNHNNAKKIKPS